MEGNLQNIGKFLAHLIVCDYHIHSEQISILNEFLEKFDIEPSRELVFNIIEGKSEENVETVIEKLSEIDQKEKEILVQNSAAIIGFNCHLSRYEVNLIELLCEKAGLDSEIFFDETQKIIYMAEEAKKENYVQERYLDNLDELSMKVRKFFSYGAKREYLESKLEQNKMSGPEYGQAIQEANEVAKEDIEQVEGNLDHIESVLKSAKTSLEEKINYKFDKETEVSQEEIELRNFLSEIFENIGHHTDQNLEEIEDVLDKKRRSTKHFTIALLGRTKSGKSTLHYVMTGEGKKFIGKGAERTTRYNRVYEWENLQIIDTPGIGAAEAEGRTDEEIALSVVDTADVICYVVTTDSVQEVEFNFLSKIRDANKPVFVLLNAKDNLQSPPPKYKKFLKNPLNWYNREDEQNISGTLKRIKRGIDSYYDGNSATIVPVHLMAEQLAMEVDNKTEKESLEAGSRMNVFFNEIRENVVELGRLRKSQTLLDNTSNKLRKMKGEVEAQIDKAHQLAEDLDNKKLELEQKISRRSKTELNYFQKQLSSIIENEKGRALEFARDNHGLGKKELKKEWQKQEEEIKSEIEKHLEGAVQRLSNDIEEDVEEILDDIDINANKENSSNFTNIDTFNTKRLISSLGAVIGTVGGGLLLYSNPVGWTVLGIGALATLVAGLFKSKEEKRQKAINEIKNKIDKNLDELEKEFRENAKETFNQIKEELSTKIGKNINEISAKYEESAEILEPYSTSLSNAIKNLDAQLGARALEFGLKRPLIQSFKENGWPQVTRYPGEVLEIYGDFEIPKSEQERIEKALKEKVQIH